MMWGEKQAKIQEQMYTIARLESQLAGSVADQAKYRVEIEYLKEERDKYREERDLERARGDRALDTLLAFRSGVPPVNQEPQMMQDSELEEEDPEVLAEQHEKLEAGKIREMWEEGM